jgi:hypothetical protein
MVVQTAIIRPASLAGVLISSGDHRVGPFPKYGYAGSMSSPVLSNARAIVLFAVSALFLSCQVVVHDGRPEHHAEESFHNHARLSDMDGMLGTWNAADENGVSTGEVVSEFRITAGGSAIAETMFAGQPHEMVTMYFTSPDGLYMTHYCAIKNHPNLSASIDEATGDLMFDCMGAGANFGACSDTDHMHHVRYHLDGDSLTATWHSMTAGELQEATVFDLVRQK